VKRHIEYFKYVCKHKWFVFLACVKLGVPIWNALIHDWSKFTPAEWNGYANSFFNNDGSRRDLKKPDGSYSLTKVKSEFTRAWHHHESHNPHHWGYWITFSADSKRYGIQSHGDGYPIFLYDFVENTRFEKEINDDGSFFVGGTNSAYNLLVEIRDRLNRDSKIVAVQMPEIYVREMVADWIGAGRAITGNRDPREWYEKNKETIILHSETKLLVEKLLSELFKETK
jgi:hypothetical protein